MESKPSNMVYRIISGYIRFLTDKEIRSLHTCLSGHNWKKNSQILFSQVIWDNQSFYLHDHQNYINSELLF